jgi:hypothetical protein
MPCRIYQQFFNMQDHILQRVPDPAGPSLSSSRQIDHDCINVTLCPEGHGFRLANRFRIRTGFRGSIGSGGLALSVWGNVL